MNLIDDPLHLCHSPRRAGTPGRCEPRSSEESLTGQRAFKSVEGFFAPFGRSELHDELYEIP
jgi:hypothetical protein